MPLFKFARLAMATRFEFALLGEDERMLRSASEEAFDEIQRLERKLSLFLPDSEISFVNRHRSINPIRLSPELFFLLHRAVYLSKITEGTFDITVGPLMRCWRRSAGSHDVPSIGTIQQALEMVGSSLLHLEEKHYALQFEKPGMEIDLGSIGKGYALECAAQILLDAGVESGLLHGGASSVYAIGSESGTSPWKIGIAKPAPEFLDHQENLPQTASETLAIAPLTNDSLSVSAVWGRGFKSGSTYYGHVIDPRTGFPVRKVLSSAVVLENPTDADALSTALLLMDQEGIDRVIQLFPNLRYLRTISLEENSYRVESRNLPAL